MVQDIASTTEASLRRRRGYWAVFVRALRCASYTDTVRPGGLSIKPFQLNSTALKSLLLSPDFSNSIDSANLSSSRPQLADIGKFLYLCNRFQPIILPITVIWTIHLSKSGRRVMAFRSAQPETTARKGKSKVPVSLARHGTSLPMPNFHSVKKLAESLRCFRF